MWDGYRRGYASNYGAISGWPAESWRPVARGGWEESHRFVTGQVSCHFLWYLNMISPCTIPMLGVLARRLCADFL